MTESLRVRHVAGFDGFDCVAGLDGLRVFAGIDDCRCVADLNGLWTFASNLSHRTSHDRV